MLEPRKSPRQARSRATVETIVEAAARVLEEDGPEGFNTNAVAARGGVSIGSVYQYFPSKQALVAELSRRNAEAVTAGLAHVAQESAGRPLRERLGAFVQFAVRQQAERPRLSRALDRLEEGLDLSTDAAGETPAILAILEPVLTPAGPGLGAQTIGRAAGDVLALARLLIDRALNAGPESMAEIELRTLAAIAGYLTAAGFEV